jgi:hypothetical protein
MIQFVEGAGSKAVTTPRGLPQLKKRLAALQKTVLSTAMK